MTAPTSGTSVVKQGALVWTEYLSRMPDRALAFYAAVAGFSFGPAAPDHGGYRQIDGASGVVGGLFPLSDDHVAGGAQSGWLPYFAVDDVDGAAARAASAGGAIIMPPWDIGGAGRFALLADPAGAPFYVMRSAVQGDSGVFSLTDIGRCCWAELVAPDADAALAFYGALFGWTHGGDMPMPGGSGMRYAFLNHGETGFGAIWSGAPGDVRPQWHLYFSVPDVDVLPDIVLAHGGHAHGEIMDVPGGRVLSARDGEGAFAGFVSPAG